MRLGAVPVFMTFVFLTGCNDASGPVATRVEITLANATGPFIEQPTPTTSKISCGVSLRAEASGGGRATWLAAWLFFYAGADRSVAVDSVQISQNDVIQGWGSAQIESGKEQFSGWVVSASAPFAIELMFRYALSDETTKEARARHTCGPSAAPGTAPPTVQASLQPSTGEIQPGDTLVLTYSAYSSVGLWETRVFFSGACAGDIHTLENFRTASAGTLKIAVPAACQLGQAFSVDFAAIDIALRGTAAKLQVSLTVVDRTPPRVAMTFGFYGSPVPTDFYFGGDTMPAYLWASDNNALQGVYREVMSWGRRDSVLGPGPTIDRRIDIPIPEGWAGGMLVRAFSRDAVGLTSDTILATPDTFRIYPTVQRPLRSITLTTDAIYDVLFDEPRGLIYLRHPDALRITVLSASDLTESASIPLPGPAYDFDLSAGGDTMVFAFGTLGALGIVDLAAVSPAVTLVPLTTLNTAFSQQPVRVRLAANGKALVVLNGASYLQTTVLEVDPVGHTERVRTDAGDNGLVGFATLERSSDHQVIVVSGDGHSQRYDALGDAFGPVHNVSAYAHQVRVDATGTRIALGLYLFDAGLTLERRVESPLWDPTAAVALSPDGGVLYQNFVFRGIVRSDANDGHLMDRIRTGNVGLMRVSPDGTKLALVNWKTIGLMDLR